MDLGCGKGGDLKKWDSLKYTEVYAVDIDNFGLRELQQRHLNMKGDHNMSINTLCADMTVDMQNFIPCHSFDVVSAMFSLHYACENQDTLDVLMKNVSYALKPGGVFIGITLASERLVDEVMTFYTQDDQQFAKFRQNPNSNTVDVTIRSISEHARREYLVSFQDFEQCMKSNGLRFASTDESRQLGLSSSAASLIEIAPTSRLSADERRYTDMYKYWVAIKT